MRSECRFPLQGLSLGKISEYVSSWRLLTQSELARALLGVVCGALGSAYANPSMGDWNLKKLLLSAAAALGLFGGVGFSGSPAEAAQIFIQQSGTAPAGGDPNVILDTSAFVAGLAGQGS